MDIRKQLLVEHSKENTNRVVNYIGSDSVKFAELMELFLSDIYRVNQRAAWVVGDAVRNKPELVAVHLESMVLNLKNPGIHDAIKRNTLRIMQELELPEELLGEAADICFKFFQSNDEAVAIKVFSMTVLYNITKRVPELADELVILIEDQMPYGSAGFRARGRKTLKALNRL